MMNLSCDVIKDLLLLYEDGVCCEESRQLVEEHLKGCAKCNTLFQNICPSGESHLTTEPLASAEFQPSTESQPSAESHLPTKSCPPTEFRLPEEMRVQEETDLSEQERKIIKKSFRKIKRRWAISLISLLFLLPLGATVGTMAYHEYRKEGICFSNLDEILLCQKFLHLLQNGNYQEAVEMMDFETKYRDIMEALNNIDDEETYQWYIDWYHHYYGIPDISQLSIEEFVQNQQLDALEYLEKYTGTIQSIRFEDAYYSSCWTISYRIAEYLPELGTQQSIGLHFLIRHGKIYLVSASYRDSLNTSESICAVFMRDWRTNYWEIEE